MTVRGERIYVFTDTFEYLKVVIMIDHRSSDTEIKFKKTRNKTRFGKKIVLKTTHFVALGLYVYYMPLSHDFSANVSVSKFIPAYFFPIFLYLSRSLSHSQFL